MILFAAAVLAYRRSLDPDYPYKDLNWKDRIVHELDELRREAVNRCYSTSTSTATATTPDEQAKHTNRNDEYSSINEEKKEDDVSKPIQPPHMPSQEQPLPLPTQTPKMNGNLGKRGFADRCDSENDDQSNEQQKSIQAQHLGISSAPSLDTATTFREDVRNEWIHAVFGTDLMETLDASSSDGKPKQSNGLARVAPFTAYEVSIPSSAFSENNNPNVSTTTENEKLGMSISRLALGLYVRAVRPGSEAYCAGVQVNSVLVSINGMSLLAESSKQALERLWQYEGHVYIQSEDTPTSPHQTPKERPNSTTHSSNTPSASSHATAKVHPEAASLCIRQPLHMTLIHHGRVYSVVLLSNPPYGIDWGPCGNFALVRKVSGRAEKAGVRRGSLIARLTSDSSSHIKPDIYELDHSLAAETVRQLTVVPHREIKVALCIPPPAARSGHYERQQEIQETKQPPRSKQKESIQRPEVAAKHEGVEVRVHPLLFSAPKSPDPTTADVMSSVTVSLSQLAFRVAAGELFSFPRQGGHTQRHHYYYSQRLCRSCPPIDKPLVDLLKIDECLAFLLQYEKAGYDEQKTLVDAPTPTFVSNYSSLVWKFLQQQSMDQIGKSLLAFSFQIVSAIQVQHGLMDSDLITRFISDFVTSKDASRDLSHRLELIAQSLDYTILKKQLASARKKRMLQDQQQSTKPVTKPQRQPRQIPVRIERAPVYPSSTEETQSQVTATTSATAPTTAKSTKKKTKVKTKQNPNGNKNRRGLFGFFRKSKKSRAKTGRDRTEENPAKDTTTQPSASSSKAVESTVEKVAKPPKEPSRMLRPRSKKTMAPASPQFNDDILFSNTLLFLDELESVCSEIEKSLLRSISQKIAGWALQPWSANKETELAQVTEVMRERLQQCQTTPLLNPIDSQPFVSIDAQGCYILPSAHFPLLLSFDCHEEPATKASPRALFGAEELYRVKVELVEMKGCPPASAQDSQRYFLVHGSLAGTILESGKSIAMNRASNRHAWDQGNVLTFDARSSWGAPKTLSLRLSEGSDTQIVRVDDSGRLEYEKDVGYSFTDLTPLWDKLNQSSKSQVVESFHSKVWAPNAVNRFDEHGDLLQEEAFEKDIDIEIKVSAQKVDLSPKLSKGLQTRKRSLLYKHDDDVRQEMFAIEFIKSCDKILQSCGLDLKLLTFDCIPVGARRGLIEWVPGSVPLSEICQPFAGSILDGGKRERNTTPNSSIDVDEDPVSSVAKAGLTKYESLRRASTTQGAKGAKFSEPEADNPIQDFLRAFAFHESDPYMISRTAMDTYVKSCAGYCVVTYVLGVGDRHLDNLLLHHTGRFFHCDYSFVLGNDPKKYLPLRITEDMVNGMGGRESDNYAMFLSLTCAAFLTMRRPENVRHLVSMVRLMEGSGIPDIETNQTIEAAILGLRGRLRLDLADDEAISFMEKLIEESCSSRMWIAVDAIHTLGKRF